jgi:type I restriction enzyme M protein
MDAQTKRAILAYVAKLDPRHEVVTLKPSADLSGGTIEFASGVVQCRVETQLKGEKYVEAYLAVKLVKELGYPIEALELQRDYPVGHPKIDRPRIDMILLQPQKSGRRTFLFIEAKDPETFEEERDYSVEHQLYGVADHERVNKLKYLVYFTVNMNGDALEEAADIIDFAQFPSFKTWTDGGRVTVDLIPREFGVARKSRFVNKVSSALGVGEKSLNTVAGPEVFASLRRDLHDVLWAGGGMFYNDIFSNLVKLFLAKIYDEETTPEGAAFGFQVRLVGNRPETPDEIFARINALFQSAQRDYLGYNDAQVKKSKGIDSEKMSESKTAYVVERLQQYSLVRNDNSRNRDVLGEFFEGIVEQGFKQSKGQFFTHINVVKFILQAMDVTGTAVDLLNGSENPAKPRLPFICDPSCGSGTFLIEAMKMITKGVQASKQVKRSLKNKQFLESMFPPSKPNRWADVYVYGLEINADLSLATKVNMVLHGDGNINIFSKDGLAAYADYGLPDKISALLNNEGFEGGKYKWPVNEQFDYILSNPPFSIKPDDAARKDFKERFEFGESPRSETLFVERWFQLLRPGGRMGVILPESVFDTPTNVELRLFLYRHFRIDAVIALPYHAFRPYTSTKTSILLATKRTHQEADEYQAVWAKEELKYKRVVTKLHAAWKALEAKDLKDAAKKCQALDAEDCKAASKLLGAARADAGTIVQTLSSILERGEAPPGEPERLRATFDAVAARFDHDIFFAEADEVGYKRRKQGGDLTRENDLFRMGADGMPVAEAPEPSTILEKLRAKTIAEPGLQGFRSRFSQIGKQLDLRCDPKYRWFQDIAGGRVIDQSQFEFVPLSHFLELAPKVVSRKGELSEERKLVELESVEGGTGALLGYAVVDEIGSDKVEFGDADILFCKLEPYLGKAILNIREEQFLGSTEWVPLRVIPEVALPGYMWGFLISPVARHAFRCLQSGKRHARISPADLLKVMVPRVPRVDQERVVAALQPKWQRIEEARSELQVLRRDAIDTLAASLRGRAAGSPEGRARRSSKGAD